MIAYKAAYGFHLGFMIACCFSIDPSETFPRGAACIDERNIKSLIVSDWESAVVVKVNASTGEGSKYTLSESIQSLRDGRWSNKTVRQVQKTLWKWNHNTKYIVCGKILTSCLRERSEDIKEASSPAEPRPDAIPSARRNVMAEPFTTEVWFSIGAILVLISITLHFVLRKEERVVHFGSEAPPWKVWETSEVLLVTLGALCQQGSPRHPDTAAARTIFTFLFSFSVIVFTAYSASVVATLAPPVEQRRSALYTDHRQRIGFRGSEIRPVDEETMQAILRSDVTLCTTSPSQHRYDLPLCVFVVHKWCGAEPDVERRNNRRNKIVLLQGVQITRKVLLDWLYSVGDKVEVRRSEYGTIHFFVNGVDQGPALSSIPYPVYGVLDLYYNAAMATIVVPSSLSLS